MREDADSDERYRAFIQNSTEGIWRFDTDEPVPTGLSEEEQIDAFYRVGFLAEANDAFARMYGFEYGEELVGARLGDLIPRDVPENEAYLWAFIRSGYRLSDVESLEVDRHGSLHHFSNSLIGIVENSGLVRAWGTQRDTTALHEAADALRASETRLRDSLSLLNAVANTTADAVFIKDNEGRYVLANPVVCALFGVPEDAVVGKTDADFLPENEAHGLRENDARIMASGKAQQYLEEFTAAQVQPGTMGEAERLERRLFQVTKSPWRDPVAGGILGVIGIAQDVTEQVTAQRALARRERDYAALIENSPDILARYNRDKRILYVNRAGERHSGMPAALLAGKSFREAGFPEEIIPLWEAALDRALQAGEAHTVAFSLRHPQDETIHHYESVLTPEFSRPVLPGTEPLGEQEGESRVDGVIAVTRDITERTRAERERAKSEERIRTLYELTSRTDIPFSDKVQRLLGLGREWLNLDKGLLARTDSEAGVYEVLQIDALGEGEALPAGFTCRLEDTFCSETVKRGLGAPPLSIEHAGNEAAWRGHPAYLVSRCESYLAAVIQVDGRAWGTLSFFSGVPRPEPFAEFDKDVVRLMTQWVGSEVARQKAEAALLAGVERQRRFLRDVVSSMTEGTFRLCLSETDLPPSLPCTSDTVVLTTPTLRMLRTRLNGLTAEMGFATERAQDILTAVGEAAMNAATHGGGGEGWVCADRVSGVVQVWVQDRGTGISEDALPKVLEKGVSTRDSLGHGFWLMLRTCDRIHLLTGPNGTTVVLEMDRVTPEPAWLLATEDRIPPN